MRYCVVSGCIVVVCDSRCIGCGLCGMLIVCVLLIGLRFVVFVVCIIACGCMKTVCMFKLCCDQHGMFKPGPPPTFFLFVYV